MPSANTEIDFSGRKNNANAITDKESDSSIVRFSFFVFRDRKGFFINISTPYRLRQNTPSIRGYNALNRIETGVFMYDGEVVIYSDVLFIINFSIDFLCLFICGRLNYRAAKWHRLVIGAVLGGVYSFTPYLLYLEGAFSVVLHFFAACVIVFCVFGKSDFRKFLRIFLTFVISEALIGGLVSAFYGMSFRYSDGRYTEISSGSLFLICIISVIVVMSYGYVTRKKIDTHSVDICMILGNEKIKASLLIDSGNLVTEPFSALPVIVLTSSCLPFPYDDPESDIFPLPIRIIPFSTSSGQSCFFGFRPDKIFLSPTLSKQKPIDVYVAVDKTRKSYSGYDGLCPTSII